MYYRLLAKKGDFHDDKMCSTMFLQAINDYAYSVLITTLVTCINNYFCVDDDARAPVYYGSRASAQQICQAPRQVGTPAGPPSHWRVKRLAV